MTAFRTSHMAVDSYGIKEVRRHGEVGSVDLDEVLKERKRVQGILARYAKKDRLNFDKAALFVYSPPDKGLATKQMSGKKRSKVRITIALLCNAEGSEKFVPLFIGKYKKPRCFGRKGPIGHGFYYRNNTKAWMTAELFAE
jgi:hypothetical protein